MPAFVTILRPLNLIQATLAVLLTTTILGELSQVNTLILLIMSVITINGAGNIINDVYDLEIDQINRPDRPLPAGKMSIPAAKLYMITLFAIGIILSSLISMTNLFIAGFIAMPVLVAYSAWFKRLPLIGNILVSFMLGLAFIYVGAAFNAIHVTFVMAALAFGFTLIRELVKDLEDMEGDQQAGAKTLPLVWGEQKTINTVVIFMAGFSVLDLLPYFYGGYGERYLWVVLLGINIPLLMSIFVLCKHPGRKNYHLIQTFLKLNIFVGLAAIYLGRPV